MRSDAFREMVLDSFCLDPDDVVLLDMLLDAMVTYETARERLMTEGETIRDRFEQLKPSPWVAIRRDARTFITTGLERLRLGRPSGPESYPDGRAEGECCGGSCAADAAT